ncbi:hypothetical protein [Candidatus Coxiella mudrowiae]|nr:hypothetical protein [Candidatus Coxiella mudrowiae]
MEHTLTAPKNGVIQALMCKTSDLVDEEAYSFEIKLRLVIAN